MNDTCNNYSNSNNDDDLEVAHPQSGSSSTCFLIELDAKDQAVNAVKKREKRPTNGLEDLFFRFT